MRCNLGFFHFQSWKREENFYAGAGCWFRIFGWGLHFTNGEKGFSERNGYIKKIPVGFGYRMGFLKRGK